MSIITDPATKFDFMPTEFAPFNCWEKVGY